MYAAVDTVARFLGHQTLAYRMAATCIEYESEVHAHLRHNRRPVITVIIAAGPTRCVGGGGSDVRECGKRWNSGRKPDKDDRLKPKLLYGIL